jgi:hypothetical protein
LCRFFNLKELILPYYKVTRSYFLMHVGVHDAILSGTILGLANNSKGHWQRGVIKPDVKCMQGAVLSGKRGWCGTCWWPSAKLKGGQRHLFCLQCFARACWQRGGVVRLWGIGGNHWGIGSGASAVSVEVGTLSGQWHWCRHAGV